MAHTKFTKQTAGYYHGLFNDELKALAKKYGFAFEEGNGRFSDDRLTMTFTIKSVIDGEKFTAEERREADCYKYLMPEGVDHVLGSRWTNGIDTFSLDKVASRGKYIFHMTNEQSGAVLCYSAAGLKELKPVLAK